MYCVAYNFTPFKSACETTLLWLKREYTGIGTGRATPSILDMILVEAYDSKMPINQLATMTVEGPKSLRLTPWDKTVVQSIDRAIRESNLGLSVALDDQGIRIVFPELTSERRTILAKFAKEKLEEARITLRNEREKTLDEIDKKEKGDEISEDDKFRLRNELQKLVDEANKKLEGLYDKKKAEIQE